MKLLDLIRKLQKIEVDIRKSGGDVFESDVMVEAVNDEQDIYYETKFELFVDDQNNVGLSPINK